MPLADISTLVNGILAFSDPANENLPATAQETAEAWADAMIAYLSTAILPPGLGAILSANRSAMVGAFVATALPEPNAPGGLFYGPGIGAIALGTSLQVLVAGAVAIPALTVPPPALYVPPAMPPTTDPTAAATILAASVAAWAVTGTHVPPPGLAPPVPWS